jgi:hypothetical protein
VLIKPNSKFETTLIKLSSSIDSFFIKDSISGVRINITESLPIISASAILTSGEGGLVFPF